MANFGIGVSLGLGVGTGALPYPLVNGFAFSYASVEMKIALPTGLKIYKGIKAINYKAPVEKTKIWGSTVEPYAQTIGKQDYEGDIELYLAEAADLQDSLGPGFGSIFFDVHITYSTPGYSLIEDVLVGCTLNSPEQGITMGSTEGLTRKYDLKPMSALFDGNSIVTNPLAGALSI
jgi:hypothetical protein